MRKAFKALKVGAVAKRLGVSATMVRSLEKLGLAKPARVQAFYGREKAVNVALGLSIERHAMILTS